MIKKPSNRFALPKVIISEVDSENILEFKVKYEKLARLDRFEIEAMQYDQNNQIIFETVKVNGGLIEVKYVDDSKKLLVNLGEEKSYEIKGQKVGGKQRLRENNRVSQTKVQLELTNNIEDKQGKTRVSRTERELIVSDNIKLYSQIVGREVKTTKEIYLIKRFLQYRSDLLFYYGFIDNFFKVAGNKKELWEIDFQDKQNTKLIEYFKFSINDHLKNDESYLKSYMGNTQQIQDDLEKCQKVFKKLRHALMHFDYDFFEKLFNNEDIGFDFDIEFLNTMIEKVDKLNIDTKKEFIDDETVKLFGEELTLKKFYGLFSHTAINRVAFNKLINSFIIKDGVENSTLKAFFDDRNGSKAYEIDIQDNSKYKALYVQHKTLVMSKSALTDGNEIAKKNQEISATKENMKEITKANSLARLEHKLRLAFGFIYVEYKDYETFKNNFDEDVKGAQFKELDAEKLKDYYLATFKNTKPKSKEKLEEVAKKVDRLSLKTLIGDEKLLKFVLLVFTFMPQELKGEFLGFVKKYYHDQKHIDQDTKDKDDEVEKLPTALKLKVLDKNIRSLSVLKHSLSFQVKYNKREKSFYEDGNLHGKFYKKLGISHNQEEFNKSVYAPLFRYYSALYKLINDFEIYSLAQYITDEKSTLNKVINSKEFHYRWDNKEKKRVPSDNYTFSTLTNKTYSLTKMKEVNSMRNQISHLSHENLFLVPLEGYKMQGKKKVKYVMSVEREKIVKAIKAQTEMQKTLGYDAVNDFMMKTIQLRTKLNLYANKEQTIEDMLENIQTPNDFYNIYKAKGVESINKHLLEVIGVTEAEKSIEKEIVKGNQRATS